MVHLKEHLQTLLSGKRVLTVPFDFIFKKVLFEEKTSRFFLYHCEKKCYYIFPLKRVCEKTPSDLLKQESLYKNVPKPLL